MTGIAIHGDVLVRRQLWRRCPACSYYRTVGDLGGWDIVAELCADHITKDHDPEDRTWNGATA